MRDRTLEGYWWLPGREDTKIAGILAYDGTEPSLRLLGAFRNESAPGSFPVEPVEAAPLIRGVCHGTAVTLLGCRQVQFRNRLGMTDGWRQTVHARLMLVGIWLDEPEEEFFDKIVIGIDHLLPWSKQSGLVRGFEQVNDRWSSPTVTWKPPEALTAQVGDASIQLRLGGATNEAAHADRTVEALTEQAGVAVTVPEPRSAWTLIDQWTKPLQDLLTLAVDTPCGLHDITLIRTNPPQQTPPDAEGPRVHPVKVEAYFAPLYRAKPDNKAVADHQVLFTLKDVSFADLLPTWFQVVDRLGPVIGMLLGQRYMARSFMENRLITAVAAAEGLHRRLLPGRTYVCHEQFDAMQATLVKAVAPEHQQWLTSRLWNEPSLKQRLMELIDRLGPEVVQPFIPKANRWARAATDARNVLVHRFNVDPSDDLPTGPVMYALAELTSAAITLLLLKEIGVSNSKLTGLANHHQSFQWVREEASKYVPKVFDISA